MNKIDLLISPYELDLIKEAVCDLGIQGMTITEVKVAADRLHSCVMSEARKHSIEYMPKLKVEIIVPEGVTGNVVDMIAKSINKEDNNNNIFISHIEDAIRIRTGQKGEDAIK